MNIYLATIDGKRTVWKYINQFCKEYGLNLQTTRLNLKQKGEYRKGNILIEKIEYRHIKNPRGKK